MPTVASVPSSVLAPPSSQPPDQKSSGSDSTAFAGLLNAGTSVTAGPAAGPGPGPAASGSVAAPAQPPASPTPVDATVSPSIQGVITQVQSLLQSGVSEKAIASSIAQAIVSALQTVLAQGQFAGVSTASSASSSSTGQSASQTVHQIAQFILQSLTGVNATKPDGKNGASHSTLNDLMTALASILTPSTKSATSDAKQTQNSFLSGIAALLQQLSALLAQHAGTAQASNGTDGKKQPVDTTQDSGGNATTTPVGGIVSPLDQGTTANTTQPSVVAPPSPQATTSQVVPFGNDLSTTHAPLTTSAAQPLADLSAHIAQLALGLASDVITAARSDVAQNPPAGGDAIVRSLGTPISSVNSSDLLLRTLERATNAAILRGDSLDGSQAGTRDILGAIQNALRQLAGGNDGNASATAKFSSADTLTASLASSLQNTGTISAPPSSGFGSGQQQTNANAANAATLGGPDDLHNIINQIVSGISIRDIGSTPTVRISLTPPQLGEVVVHLSVGADQNVSATITTSTAEARATVLANIPELNRSLQASGLKLGYLGVDLANQGQQYEQKQQEQRAQQRSNRSSAVAATPEIAGQDPPSGPSLLNTVNLQLLNQLV